MLKCPQICQRDQRAESGRCTASPSKASTGLPHRQLPSREAATDLFYFYLLPPMLRFLRNNLVHNSSLFWGIVPPSQQIPSHRGDRLWTGRGCQRVTKEEWLSKASHSSCPSHSPTPPQGVGDPLFVGSSFTHQQCPSLPRHSAKPWGHQNRLQSMVTVTHGQFA